MLNRPDFFSPGTFTTSDVWRLLFYVSVALAVVLLSVFWSVRVAALHDHLADSQKQLTLYTAHVAGELAKYQAIPALLATNQRVRKVLEQPHNLSARQALNEYFEQSAQASQALAIYLMDRQGVTQAASNWQAEETFIGRRFAYRPYFRQALQGRTGRYSALGTTSAVRGYYFAEPVYQLGQVIGVVVVKLDVSVLEQRWRGARQQVFVTDADGVIFIATRPTWLYHAWLPLTAAVKQQIRRSQRYPGQSLPILSRQTAGQFRTATLVQMTDDSVAHHYLHVQQPMPAADWQLHVLNPLDEVDSRAWQATWIALTLCGIGLIGAAMLWQRQQYHVQARQMLEQAHNQLEQRVQARTADLQHQIEERQRAETALHAAQDKLVQAAKLAMLGQLSASVAHELNQPLSAIRSYAGNAQLLLQRDATTDVAANLSAITQLVARMARISAQLKQFARKSSGECIPVSLAAAIQVSAQLWQRELEQAGVTLQIAATTVQILADATRLEQVLVNLIGNALQALIAAQTAQPRISIRVHCTAGFCYVTVSDNGPGIPEAQLNQIFDPFFTTRQAGLGLGLAISQQIIEHSGGTLTVARASSGGAAFTFSLPLA